MQIDPGLVKSRMMLCKPLYEWGAQNNLIVIDVSDVEVLFDMNSSKRYGASGTIINGGFAAHACELEANRLLQSDWDYTRGTDKVRGDHDSLASTVK